MDKNGAAVQGQSSKARKTSIKHRFPGNSVNVDHNAAVVPDQGESSKAPLSPSTFVSALTSCGQPLHNFQLVQPDQIAMIHRKNKAREFPGAENRTPEQQAYYERKAISSRKYRHKIRVEQLNLIQEAEAVGREYQYNMSRIAATQVYLNALCNTLGSEEADWTAQFNLVEGNFVKMPAPIRWMTKPQNSLSNSDDVEGQQQTEEYDGETPLDLSMKCRKMNNS